MKKMIMAVMLIGLSLMSGCTFQRTLDTQKELLPVLDDISQGEREVLQVQGIIEPWSGSPSGKYLAMLNISSIRLPLCGSAVADLFEGDHNPYMEQRVSARITIEHFPGEAAGVPTQLKGYWITEVENIRVL